MRFVLLFIDGLGLGYNDKTNNPCALPGIKHLAYFQDSDQTTSSYSGIMMPADANLGIPGLPQSATGQTTIFTGVNCARLLGRHLQGYPNQALRDVMRDRCILKLIKEMGLRPAFINAYRPLFFKLNKKIKWHLSATTIANLSADLPFLSLDDIKQRKSIYHDFTNASLVKRGFDVPRFTPEVAGQILGKISKQYTFILYEYFLTDRAGHSHKIEIAAMEIQKLDRFLSGFLKEVDLENTLVILTSDHGNIEDMSVKTHTRNPVMTILWGQGAEIIKERIHTLADITPSILWMLKNGHTS
jgi:2,3-bisphosphoglycerate-independent phosphoglycerate mutase